MTSDHPVQLKQSRAKLLEAIGRPKNLTLILPPGNIGDDLIYAGTRQLLAGLDYQEVELSKTRDSRGDTALIGGSGGWCGPYQGLPQHLARLESRFDRVIILPSSFDTNIEIVRRALSSTKATVFAREEVSFGQIRSLCQAEIAHDCAFFFDFSPYRRAGHGTLMALRTDREAAFDSVPLDNRDISITCHDLEEWLNVIADHELIRTDRAHVTIAGALLGKRVEYRSSNYHKVPAIVDFALREFDVVRLPDQWDPVGSAADSRKTDIGLLRTLTGTIDAHIPERATFLLVDHGQIEPFPLAGRTRVPFLERDGIYWGPPVDDATAIRELEGAREKGATFIAFAWPAFWWLDHYTEFHRYLRTHFCCLQDNDSVKVFDLRTTNGSGADDAGRRSTDA